MLTGNKLAENLREKLIKRNDEKSRKGNDPRFLNYFDMNEGQEMHVLLLPDGGDSGELFMEYENHGGGIRGVRTINCSYVSNGEDCVVCDRSWNLHSSGDKEGANQFRRREHAIAQCVVLKSPVEVPMAEDGNIVKLINLPFKVKETIVNSVVDEIIEDPTAHVLVIKKTKNAGGRASYDRSHFKPQPVGEDDIPTEVVTAIENGNLNPFNLADEIPDATTSADMVEWLNDTDEKLAAREAGSGTTRTRTSGGTPKGGSEGSSEDAGDATETEANDGGSGGDSPGENLMARLRNRQRS